VQQPPIAAVSAPDRAPSRALTARVSDGWRTHVPLLARIVGIVDTYEALTTERPYQRAIASSRFRGPAPASDAAGAARTASSNLSVIDRLHARHDDIAPRCGRSSKCTATRAEGRRVRAATRFHQRPAVGDGQGLEGSDEKILIVEDDRVSLQMMSVTLRNEEPSCRRRMPSVPSPLPSATPRTDGPRHQPARRRCFVSGA
jgi:hypothetical protein